MVLLLDGHRYMPFGCMTKRDQLCALRYRSAEQRGWSNTRSGLRRGRVVAMVIPPARWRLRSVLPDEAAHTDEIAGSIRVVPDPDTLAESDTMTISDSTRLLLDLEPAAPRTSIGIWGSRRSGCRTSTCRGVSAATSPTSAGRRGLPSTTASAITSS